MKKALLIVALFITVFGIADIDADSILPVILIVTGGSYLFLSLIANWDFLVKRIEKGNM